jgi:hypothetical protein
MRIVQSLFIVLGCLILSGCGCLECCTESKVVAPGRGVADPTQPGWQQCLFGTRHVPLNPGDRSFELKEADPDQTAWDRFVNGTRYVPRRAPSPSFPTSLDVR